MRWSLTTSLALHAVILAVALIVLPAKMLESKPQNAIQVDITNIGDISKRMAQAKDAVAPADKPAPKKADTVVKTDPAPVVDKKVEKAVKEAAAEPPPVPKPEPPKPEPPKPADARPLDPNPLKDLIKSTVADTPDPKKDPPKKADVKPPDKKKPEKKPPKLNPDEIAAFLNKTDTSKSPDAASATDSKPAKGQKNTQGMDQQASADILDALTQKLKECWTVPPGAREAKIDVQVHFLLKADGTLIGQPEVMNPSSDPLFDATARSAVSAVIDCQAYSFLPQDRYDLWKDNTIDFSPNMMTDS